MKHSLADRLRQFHVQSQGAFSCELIRPEQALASLSGVALRDGAFAACFHRLVQKLENGSSIGCLCCDRSAFTLQRLPSLYVFNFPAGNAASNGMLSAVCADCTTRPSEEIFADVQRSLAVVWSDLKIIGATIGAGHA
jgi:hypothetical protein